MPKSVQELREERSTLAKKVHDLVEQSEDKDWTSANDEEYNKLCASIESIDKHIERKQNALNLDLKNHIQLQNVADQQGISVDEAQNDKDNRLRIMRDYLVGGFENLSAEDRELIRERNRNPQNALTTGAGASGGFTVENEFVATLLEAMKAYGGMREVATVMRTNSGSQMTWPTTNVTSQEGEIVAENVNVSSEDPEFGQTNLDTYKYSSKSVAVPFELLQDTEIDLEGFLQRALVDRLGRITNRHFTVGTGVGQPTGIITATGTGFVAGSPTAITLDDLINLEHSVDPAYRNSGSTAFMFNDATLRLLRLLKDLDGRPIWMPGYVEGSASTILGHRYVINQNVATAAAGSFPIAFGDFSKYMIRDVMQFLFFRMTDSKYTEAGQVGFLGFLRSGGNLVDVGGAVKKLEMAA